MQNQVDFRMIAPRDIPLIRKKWKRKLPSFLLGYETEYFTNNLENNLVETHTTFKTEEINLKKGKSFRHVTKRLTNLLKMLQLPDFYQESFTNFCENKEVRNVADEISSKDADVDSKDKVCFCLLESEEKKKEGEVLLRMFTNVRNELVQHSIDVIEEKVKEDSPFKQFGHIQFGKINLEHHKNFKTLIKKIEKSEMTDVLAILIWPDNNKFDVIPVDKDFEAAANYKTLIKDYLYNDDYLGELLYLREFTKTNSFKDFLEMEHYSLINDGFYTCIQHLKQGKMLVGLLAILFLSLCFSKTPIINVCSIVCPLYLVLAMALTYVEIKSDFVIVDI